MTRPWALQRLELHLSGVPVPRLGSVQDLVIRKFMVRRAELDISKTKILARIAAGVGPDSGQEASTWISNVNVDYKDYVYKATWAEHYREDRNKLLLDEYSRVKHLTPVIKKTEEGLVVYGLQAQAVTESPESKSQLPPFKFENLEQS